eukprot:1808518-Alexandrium_andersonii.AAC.1
MRGQEHGEAWTARVARWVQADVALATLAHHLGAPSGRVALLRAALDSLQYACQEAASADEHRALALRWGWEPAMLSEWRDQ